jgi:hypothetical protein
LGHIEEWLACPHQKLSRYIWHNSNNRFDSTINGRGRYGNSPGEAHPPNYNPPRVNLRKSCGVVKSVDIVVLRSDRVDIISAAAAFPKTTIVVEENVEARLLKLDCDLVKIMLLERRNLHAMLSINMTSHHHG